MKKTGYIACHFDISPVAPADEILIAELSGLGFESFEQTEKGVIAYIEEHFWSGDLLKDVRILQNPDFQINFRTVTLPAENWNAVWESNFQPINIDDKIYLRANFHPKPKGFLYDIVITPKMSFGTGHHETTYLMLQHLLEANLENKSVLDMGCGTGILGIFARLKNAKNICAIDIDPWCYENTIENIRENNVQNILVKRGGAEILPSDYVYDFIIANINKNILVADMKKYVACLKAGGEIILSGFYETDFDAMQKIATENGLIFKNKVVKNKWMLLCYLKK